MLRTLNKSQVFARVRRLEYIEREYICMSYFVDIILKEKTTRRMLFVSN